MNNHWATDKSNVPAAVHDRLLQFAKEREMAFNAVAVRYATERLLYRLSRSEHMDSFVLKGAWLFYLWDIQRRATRDVDFLGHGENSVEHIEQVICEVSQLPVTPDDGLRFDASSADSYRLREVEEYSGVRVRITAYLGTAEIRAQVDVGFGDVLVDDPILAEIPALIDYPRPQLHVYHAEASIAEKLEAMVRFGAQNSRMKDYFDLFTLSRERSFQSAKLEEQISATFSRRETSLPRTLPAGLSDEFGRDRQGGWEAFLDDAFADEGAPTRFGDVVTAVRMFVYPPMRALSEKQPLQKTWTAEDGWA